MAASTGETGLPFEPDWPTCQRTLDSPCPGIQIRGFDRCLEHLAPAELDPFLASLHPGDDLDVRGTTIAASLSEKLRVAFQHTNVSRPVFGFGRFEDARIINAAFFDAQFERDVDFSDARFDGNARFDGARFGGNARFNDARFEWTARFTGARFDGEARFDGAWFGDAWFDDARFENAPQFGPVRARWLSLDRAQFTRSIEMDVEAGSVSCASTRFEDGVTLRVRYGTVAAFGTVFGAASSIGSTGPHSPWSASPAWVGELTERPDRLSTSEPMLTSLRGTDVSNLVLTDVYLGECEFAGAHRLDQLRVEGRCEFRRPPLGWRWTRRQVLAEEARWRGWPTPAIGPEEAGPERLAALYRSLRKAFEDSKNEAGAGDFYYGEMEMRRHSTGTRRAERGILWVYWLLSGYGQRAGRALAALLVLIATVAVLLAVWGQPPAEAAQIAVGAVVLRDPGTKLTEAGQWTVMVARVLGPVLLALAVLAVRGRVKR